MFICPWAGTPIFTKVGTESPCGQATTNVATGNAISSRGCDGDDRRPDSIRSTRRPAVSRRSRAQGTQAMSACCSRRLVRSSAGLWVWIRAPPCLFVQRLMRMPLTETSSVCACTLFVLCRSRLMLALRATQARTRMGENEQAYHAHGTIMVKAHDCPRHGKTCGRANLELCFVEFYCARDCVATRSCA